MSYYINIEQQMEKEVNEIKKNMKKEIDQLVVQLKRTLPKTLWKIKQEIFGSFQAIVSSEMQKSFLEIYGVNYDVKSLNDSLSFFIDNNLNPQFSYDKSIFKFNPSLKNDVRKFNQNARHQTRFDDFSIPVEFDSIEQEDRYYEDNPFDVAIDLISHGIGDSEIFSPQNKMNQQGGYSSLDETYRKAETETWRAWNIHYKKVIKPRIEKKYGIKL